MRSCRKHIVRLTQKTASSNILLTFPSNLDLHLRKFCFLSLFTCFQIELLYKAVSSDLINKLRVPKFHSLPVFIIRKVWSASRMVGVSKLTSLLTFKKYIKGRH